jgi:dimethylamine monooxygenase subunit A
MPPAAIFSTLNDQDGLEPVLNRFFGGSAYEFEFGGRRSSRNWFRLPESNTDALQLRRNWLTKTPELTLHGGHESAELISGLAGLFGEQPSDWAGRRERDLLAAISRSWPHDVLLLQRGREAVLRAAAVCFPSSWRPEEKIGRPIVEIHAPVPRLNAALGSRIGMFLDRLPPGVTYERENWGFAATAEPNLHPSRHLGGLPADASIERVWLRLEHQAFRALPGGQGLVFVIGLTVLPLGEVVDFARWRAGVIEMLKALPEDVAEYKGLARGRTSLLASLGMA